MRHWIAGWGLLFSVAAGAVALPIPDALEVQTLAGRRDAAALQVYLQRFQRQYESDPTTERPLIQVYWALGDETDTGLEKFYDRWVNALPTSYEARLSRAMYRWNQADLIVHPAAYKGVATERSWLRYADLMQQARQDIEASLTLTARPLASYRALIAVCGAQNDEACVEQAYRKGLAIAPHSLALRRGYVAVLHRDVRAQVISEARAQGVSAEAIKVLEAEKRLFDSGEIMRADGGTEVAIYVAIGNTVQDPWIDELIGSMFYRRSSYQRAVEFFSRALASNPNMGVTLYWRALSYYAMGDLLAGRADMMRAALIGNPQANRDLIDQHIHASNGAKRDAVEMAHWCELATQRNQGYGLFCMGDVYANGYAGYAKNMQTSLALTQRAAELGQPMAQHDMGVMRLKGSAGVAPDRAEGIYWLKLSAQSGFEYAEPKLRMHLSDWEYFKEITWPGYLDAFRQGNFNVAIIVSLLNELVRAIFS